MSVDVMAAMDETLGHLTMCRLPKEGNLSREHLRGMRAEVAGWDLADRSRLEKANRYLGWMQGVAEAKGVSNDVLREINRVHSVEPTPFDVLEIHISHEEFRIEFHPEAPEMCWHTAEAEPAGWETLAMRLLQERDEVLKERDEVLTPERRYMDALALARTLVRERTEARQWIVVLAAAVALPPLAILLHGLLVAALPWVLLI